MRVLPNCQIAGKHPAFLRLSGCSGLATLLLWLLVLLPAAAQPAAVKDDTMAVDTTVRDDSYRLEAGYTTLSRISGQVRQVLDTRPLAEELPDVVENLRAIQYTLKQPGEVVDIKHLQMCQLMLRGLQQRLTTWRAALGTANKQLAAMQAQLRSLPPPPPRAAHPDAPALALERSDSAL